MSGDRESNCDTGVRGALGSLGEMRRCAQLSGDEIPVNEDRLFFRVLGQAPCGLAH